MGSNNLEQVVRNWVSVCQMNKGKHSERGVFIPRKTTDFLSTCFHFSNAISKRPLHQSLRSWLCSPPWFPRLCPSESWIAKMGWGVQKKAHIDPYSYFPKRVKQRKSDSPIKPPIMENHLLRAWSILLPFFSFCIACCDVKFWTYLFFIVSLSN